MSMKNPLTRAGIEITRFRFVAQHLNHSSRVKTECDGTRAETRFGLPAKRTSLFISAGVSV